jgi:hypothetical protein
MAERQAGGFSVSAEAPLRSPRAFPAKPAQQPCSVMIRLERMWRYAKAIGGGHPEVVFHFSDRGQAVASWRSQTTLDS